VSAGSFGVYRQSPTQLNVYAYSFRHSTQLKYFIDQQRMTVEDRRFRWDQFLTGMHGRGGFEQEGLLDRSWSVIVDLVCLAIALWIALAFTCGGGSRAREPGGFSLSAPAAATFLFFTMRL
jgi:hypothetical protein